MFFWLGIGVAAALNPPEAEVSLAGDIELVTVGGYLSLGRLTVGEVFRIVGTEVARALVDGAVSEK